MAEAYEVKEFIEDNKWTEFGDLEIPLKVHYFKTTQPFKENIDAHCKTIEFFGEFDLIDNPEYAKGMSKNFISECRHFLILGYPNCTDPHKMNIVTISMVWLFILDDVCTTRKISEHLLEFIADQSIDPINKIEEMYRKFAPILIDGLSSYMKNVFKDFLNAFIVSNMEENLMESSFVDKMDKISCEEFIKERKKAIFANIICIWQDYLYSNIQLNDEEFNNPIMLKYIDCVFKYAFMANDLYSFRKEINEVNAIMNYVRVVRYNHACTWQEAVYKICDEMKDIEFEILNLVNQLHKDTKLARLGKYVENSGDILHMLLSFGNSNRYSV